MGSRWTHATLMSSGVVCLALVPRVVNVGNQQAGRCITEDRNRATDKLASDDVRRNEDVIGSFCERESHRLSNVVSAR